VPPSEHSVMKSCGFQPSTDRKLPSGWATVPGFIHRVRVCYSLTGQSKFGTQCTHLAFATVQTQHLCCFQIPWSVSLSVCPLIKSILYKYKATDGYGETSNEHVTEGHTVIALIINKPNMASVRTWVWIYCSCSWKGLTVTKLEMSWSQILAVQYPYVRNRPAVICMYVCMCCNCKLRVVCVPTT
jgi:hypothetical protein